MEEAGFPAGALDGFVPVSYERYYAAAPGIVLIKTPAMHRGSRSST